MRIVRAAEVEGLRTPPPHVRELKVLISPALQQEATNISVGMTILPPGETSSFHSHEAETETWVILSGEGEVVVGEERASVGPETVILNPPGHKHQLVNSGTVPLRVLWIYTPPGPEASVLDGSFR